MKKNLLYIVFLLGFMLVACGDEEGEDEMWFDEIISTWGAIVILDEQGNDLLDPDTEGCYDPEKFRIYFVKDDGSTELFYKPASDCPYGFLYPSADEQRHALGEGIGKYFYVSMALYDWDICSGADHSKVILQWNEHERDTLECELGDRGIEKVYSNGELIWKEYDVSPIWEKIITYPSFKLIKEKNTSR